jgi:diguanylate cyclase (GGDEF)-like protein
VTTTGTALRAVLDIQAVKTVAYEALARPDDHELAAAEVRAALALARHTSPAVLIVPLSTALLEDGDFDPVQEAHEAGLPQGEVAFILGHGTGPSLGPAALRRAEALHAAGYLVAIDGVGSKVLAEPEAGDLRPSFVMLDPDLSKRALVDQRCRAELAGLLAYFARLGGRIVARDIDDARSAKSLLELGVQFGSGSHLDQPVVLDRAVAAEGDGVVDAAWFRARPVRVLAERPETAGTTTLLPALARLGDDQPVGDREFARTLAEAARLLQAEHDPARIIAVIGDLLPRVVPVDRLAVFEADWDHHRLRPRLVIGDELAGLLDMDDSMTTGITGWAFPRGVPYNCPDTEHHPAAASVPGSRPQGEESLLVIPLIAGDHRLGALDLWRDGLAQFSDEDVERSALFGYLAAAAWRNAQLYAELERRAMTDTLTGLLNTRWWSELAPREAAQSRRLGTEIAVLLCDLDHFKKVNDRFGHAAGDIVLRCTARVLRSAMRSGDAAVRYGGEEFLLVMRESDEEGALRVARSVQEGIRDMPTPIDGLPPLTVSIGIAFFPRHGQSLDEVLAHADAAMYQAKHEGRDRIVFARNLTGDEVQVDGGLSPAAALGEMAAGA